MQGHREPNFTSVFLDILNEISEEEMKVLAGFYHVYIERKTRPNKDLEIAPIDYNTPQIAGFSSMVYKTLLQSLIQKGLLFDNSLGDLMPKHIDSLNTPTSAWHSMNGFKRSEFGQVIP